MAGTSKIKVVFLFKMEREHTKYSFKAAGSNAPRVLILGSLPGDASLALQEYYGNPRNRFWPVVAACFGEELPKSYEEKLALLVRCKVAVWDVAQTAVRKGSLDTAIQEVKPNALQAYIEAHPTLKLIGFNGRKANELYLRFFSYQPGVQYVTLPSTSPANAGCSWELLLENWGIIGNGGK